MSKPKLETLRSEIEVLAAAVEHLEDVPVSRGELEARIRARLGHADDGSPLEARWGGFTAPGRPMPVDLEVDMAALVAILGIDVVTDRMVDHLVRRFGEGPDAADREKELAAKRAQLHKLEVAEETEVLKLEATGVFTPRRPDAGVAAILEAWND